MWSVSEQIYFINFRNHCNITLSPHCVCYLLLFGFFSDGAHSQIKVAVSSESEFVNEGDDFVAYCNITGLRPYDILRIKVQWLHNGKRISDYCKLLDYDLYSKYSCRLLSPMPGDLIVEQTILSMWQSIVYNLYVITWNLSLSLSLMHCLGNPSLSISALLTVLDRGGAGGGVSYCEETHCSLMWRILAIWVYRRP